MDITKCNRNKMGLLICFVVCFICGSQQVMATEVKIDEVKPWDSGERVALYCSIAVSHTNQISSYAEAELLWAKPEGSRVTEGDLIAEQDGFFLAREKDILEVRIGDIKSNMTFAQKEYDRLLKSNEFVSKTELNVLQRRFDAAKYQLEEMQFNLKVIEYRIGKLQHFAPFDGKITSLMANLGENIVVGQPILQLIANKYKELACRVPLDISQNDDISNAQFQFQNIYSLDFKRQQALALGSEQSVMVFLTLPEELKPSTVVDKRVKVTMQNNAANTIQVPFDAMVLGSDGNYVWRLDENNKIHKQIVHIITAQTSSFIVRSEMKPGTRVVVRGKQAMKDGEEVTISGAAL